MTLASVCFCPSVVRPPTYIPEADWLDPAQPTSVDAERTELVKIKSVRASWVTDVMRDKITFHSEPASQPSSWLASMCHLVG